MPAPSPATTDSRPGVSGGLIAVAAALALLFAPSAQAQGQGGTAQGMPPAPLMQGDESGALPYGFSVSIGVGRSSGATAIGSVEDETAGTTTGFEIGDGTLIEVHGVKRLWWRLAGEAEIGHASPGVDAILSDLDGSNRTRTEFGSLGETYFTVALRLDMVDAWITPFLLAGISVVHSSADDGSSTEPGFLFGGGVEVSVHGPFFVRADVRGLRSKVDAPTLTQGLLEVESGSPVATRVLWTVGAGIRF